MRFPPGPDPYAILGVTPGATDAEIDKAYRTLQRIHHPDRGGSAELSARINHAHDILSDPVKRREYDRERFGSRATAPPPPSDAPGFRPPPPSPSEQSRRRRRAQRPAAPPLVASPTAWRLKAWGLVRHPRTPLSARQLKLVRVVNVVLVCLVVVGLIVIGATTDGVALVTGRSTAEGQALVAGMALSVTFVVAGLSVHGASAVSQYGWRWAAIGAGVARRRSGGTLAVVVGVVVMALVVVAAR